MKCSQITSRSGSRLKLQKIKRNVGKRLMRRETGCARWILMAFSGNIFTLQQGNMYFEGSKESLGQFSWVPCTSHHHLTDTLTMGLSVLSTHHPWPLHPWNIYSPPTSFSIFQSLPLTLLSTMEVQNKAVMIILTQGLIGGAGGGALSREEPRYWSSRLWVGLQTCPPPTTHISFSASQQPRVAPSCG